VYDGHPAAGRMGQRDSEILGGRPLHIPTDTRGAPRPAESQAAAYGVCQEQSLRQMHQAG